MRVPVTALFLLCLAAGTAAALEITAISPAAGFTGQMITLTGGPFTDEAEILFGDKRLRPDKIDPRQLVFAVPPLPEGEYALRVRSGEATEVPVFTFRIVPATPQLRSLLPATLDACSLLQGQPIVLNGEFPPSSQVLLDGAVIPAEAAGRNEITLVLPPLQAGMHQVEVAGPGERRSLPHALFVDGVPKITAVSQGADYVTSYEVVIRGENFLYSSVLAVNGSPVNQAVEGDVAQNYTALHRLGGEDYVRYVDCQSLVYIRHPLTRVPDTVTLQVINPGGEQSSVYVVVIP